MNVLLAEDVEHFVDLRRRGDVAETDLIGLVLGNQDLHPGREHLEDIESADGGVDLLLLDPDHLRHAMRWINGFLADSEVVNHGGVLLCVLRGPSPASNAGAILAASLESVSDR
jgi:hypothetical protein